MSNRARYETKDGEFLTISRGALRIRSGETGAIEERSISGEVSYDAKTRQLSVPVHVVNVDKDTKVRSLSTSTIVFEITKDPGQIRSEMRGSFVGVEQSRLVNLVKSLPKTLGADPSGMGGSPNPAYEAAMAALTDFCKRYSLSLAKVLGLEKQEKPAEAAAPTEKPRKKAKERRAEKEKSAS